LVRNYFRISIFKADSDFKTGEIVKKKMEGIARLYPEHGRPGRDSILLHPSRRRWIRINASAREILEEFWKSRSFHQTAMAISRRHALDLSEAARHVRTTVSKLKDDGFLRDPRSRSCRTDLNLRSLYLQITARCNLSCAHCCYSCSPASNGQLARQKIVELIDESTELGATSITLSGGEPLLHPDLRDIIRHAASRMDIQLTTNGMLIDDEWAAFLADLPVRIQISLDSSQKAVHERIRGRGTFNKTMAAVDRLQKAGCDKKLILALTMMSSNLARLDDMIVFAEQLGIPRLRFLPLRQEGNAGRNWAALGAKAWIRKYERFYDRARRPARETAVGIDVSCGLSGFVPHPPDIAQADDIWCPIGTYVVVAADGEAYSCPLLMTGEFALGSVYRRSLGVILSSKKWQGICRTLSIRKNEILRCSRCLWNNLCQGGCMGLALGQKGNIWDTDVFCDYRQKAYRQAFQDILEHPRPPRPHEPN